MRDTKAALWGDSGSWRGGREEEVCCEEVCEGKRETEGWATQREAKFFKGVGYSTGEGGLVMG
jgi:hypothetical protein